MVGYRCKRCGSWKLSKILRGKHKASFTHMDCSDIIIGNAAQVHLTGKKSDLKDNIIGIQDFQVELKLLQQAKCYLKNTQNVL